jgi:hypothetical protein
MKTDPQQVFILISKAKEKLTLKIATSTKADITICWGKNKQIWTKGP